MAVVVALAAVVSLVGSYVRAPEAVLGVAFARACAAETAVTEGGHPRFRVDREDARRGDVEGLAPDLRATKTAASLREVDGRLSLRVVATTTATSLVPPPPVVGESGLGWRPIDPPTRARARLMVFLN